jgi:hypothetical protein
MVTEYGPIYTKGNSYRARAEVRQREYRALVLAAGHGRYGHLLAPTAAASGQNFALREAFEAALVRRRAGKSVAPRTFENMLSSQAMCFNIFAPLASRLGLASEVLAQVIPGMSEATAIHIEHTPSVDVFDDQSGRGGVDCDVLVDGKTPKGDRLVLVIESKFVEPEFSVCGFRKAGRGKKATSRSHTKRASVGARPRSGSRSARPRGTGRFSTAGEFSRASGLCFDVPRQSNTSTSTNCWRTSRLGPLPTWRPGLRRCRPATVPSE